MKGISQQIRCLRLGWLLPVLLALPTSLQAQLTFAITNGLVTIRGYTGNPTVLAIPSVTNGYPVIGISGNSFISKTSLISVSMPNSVIAIGSDAFYECYNLNSIILSTNLTSIGDYALGGCSGLTNITIPNSVNSIGEYAFVGCEGLTNIILSTNLTSIEQATFYGCSGLTNITIPNTITNIGQSAFADCEGLINIILSTNLTSIGEDLFGGCYSLKNITIPNTVTNIGQNAFYGCTSLTSEIIPNNVISIGSYAFASSPSLTSVYFTGNAPTPANDTSVFSGDNNLTVYYLPGMTGWGTNFDRRPTMLWNPQVQTRDGNFGMNNNGFGFNITGTTNLPILLEACTNLGGAWVPLETVSLTNGSFNFFDPQWTNYPGRFYRISTP